jgi:hypothetical protein
VLAIRAGTVTTSPLTHWLGGQHGEEAKDEGSGEEDGEEDQAPEEEVGTAPPRSSTSLDVDDRVKRAGGC